MKCRIVGTRPEPFDNLVCLARLYPPVKVCIVPFKAYLAFDIPFQDHGLSVVPTKEWQDNLAQRLAFSSTSHQHSQHQSSNSFPNYDLNSHQATHISQKRRVNSQTSSTIGTPDWSIMYTMEPETGQGVIALTFSAASYPFQTMRNSERPQMNWGSCPSTNIRK